MAYVVTGLFDTVREESAEDVPVVGVAAKLKHKVGVIECNVFSSDDFAHIAHFRLDDPPSEWEAFKWAHGNGEPVELNWQWAADYAKGARKVPSVSMLAAARACEVPADDEKKERKRVFAARRVLRNLVNDQNDSIALAHVTKDGVMFLFKFDPTVDEQGIDRLGYANKSGSVVEMLAVPNSAGLEMRALVEHRLGEDMQLLVTCETDALTEDSKGNLRIVEIKSKPKHNWDSPDERKRRVREYKLQTLLNGGKLIAEYVCDGFRRTEDATPVDATILFNPDHTIPIRRKDVDMKEDMARIHAYVTTIYNSVRDGEWRLVAKKRGCVFVSAAAVAGHGAEEGWEEVSQKKKKKQKNRTEALRVSTPVQLGAIDDVLRGGLKYSSALKAWIVRTQDEFREIFG